MRPALRQPHPMGMSQSATQKIAILGIGQMGAAMASRLLDAGYSVSIWNRTAAATAPLVAEGATPATTPTEAAKHCDVLLTMLFDDAAYEQVLLGENGALAALPTHAVHIACGTISVALSQRLDEEHKRLGHAYVAAPVFGRPNVAADGRLWIVVAGDPSAVEHVRPLLALLSRGISVVGDRPAQAHAVKLAGNFMITMMIQAMSEAVVFAQEQGIDPTSMLETINSALFQSPFYATYGKLLLNPPPAPGATLSLGLKDVSLFLAAANDTHVHPEVASLIAQRLRLAVESGLGSSDWASGMLQAAQAASRP